MKIGVFAGGVQYEFAKIVLGAMTDYANKNNITLMIFSIFDSGIDNMLYAEGQKSIFDLPDFNEFDGIIVLGDTLNVYGMRTKLMKRIKKEAICPVVCLREYEEGYNNVLVDNEQAMYDVTKHFIEHHHFTDIGFITGRMEMSDAKERLAGYKRAMEEAGLSVTEDMIYYGNYWRAFGKEMVDFFFDGNKKKPQAIVSSNDYMALALCEELNNRGIKIPDDVCVSGFDDFDDAQLFKPPLSSVSVPFEEMAVACMDRIVDIVNGNKDLEKDLRIKPIPKFRGSCGCCDPVTIRDELIKADYDRYRYMTQTCIFMSTDFECILSEQECIDTTGRIALELGAKNIYICLCEKVETDEDGNEIIGRKSFSETMHLRYYYDTKGEAVKTDVVFERSKILPDDLREELYNRTSYILPINSKSEVFGYIILQFDEKESIPIEERFDFLCINFGIGLSKVYMYEEITSMSGYKQLYLRDSLTGVYNRRGFENEIAKLHRKRKEDKFDVAAVSVDMDGLKYVNDNFGHIKGDEAIISVGNCIKNALAEGEFCARMGGDEFEAFLIVDTPDRVEKFKDDVVKSLSEVNSKIEDDYVVDASIGVCIVPHWENIVEAVNEADRLMYEEKRSKKNKQGKR